MKVFISYSRIDASETANIIHNYLTEYGHHEVFIDTSNIHGGDEWWNTIQNAISHCDIFVIIITPSALYRSEVDKEVNLAKNLKKKIIPCIAKDYVEENEIKWELNKVHGIFYESDAKLAMDLHIMIRQKSKSQISTEIKTEGKKGEYSSISEKQNFGETESIHTFLNKAKGLEKIGQYARALKAYDEALKLNHNNFEVYYNKGLLHDKIGDLENARKALDTATELDWQHQDVWYHLGNVLEKLERYDEALAAIDSDLLIDNNDIKSWTSKARILEKMEKYDKTLEAIDEIISIDSTTTNNNNNIDALKKKGKILIKLNRYHDALKTYETVLELEPENVDALYHKTEILLDLGEYDDALNCYSKIPKEVKPSRKNEHIREILESILVLKSC